MSIHINNTLTGRKEEFIPIKDSNVGIYVCGPTVYDEPHIGHVRSSLIFEVIRRYFGCSGYKVTYIKNITDVDDKIINVALGDEDSTKDIASKVKEIALLYEEKYHDHMKLLGINRADIEPRATEHIDDMIKMIEGIIEKGYAYESRGNVYFSVKKYNQYGSLSGQSIENIGKEKRLDSDESKKDSLDFALWKKSKDNEPGWQSPWGVGRPGWHIECSAMSTKYLGNEFDIHCGGRDLIFPHHENEIAQTKAYGGDFAHYWIHNGLLTINSEKMSKSLGNFITVKDALEKHSPDAINILFLSTHYSNPLDFTWERLDEAEKSAERFRILFKRIKPFIEDAPSKDNNSILDKHIKAAFLDFKKAMDDDFNTALALSKMFDLVNFINKFLDNKNKDISPGDKALLVDAEDKLRQMGSTLCLFNEDEDMNLSDELVKGLIDTLIKVRNIARGEKLFNISDEIRDDLSKLGVVLEDTDQGTEYRITRVDKKS